MKTHVFVLAVFSFLLFVFISDLTPQWSNNHKITDKKLNSAAMIDDLSAIVVGEKGTVMFTQDRGNSWSTQKLATNQSLNGVAVVNVIPTKNRVDEENYASFVVGDGGKIYKLYKRAIDLSVDSDFDLKAVAFRNSVQGIAVGQKYDSFKDQKDDMDLTERTSHPASASIIVTRNGGKTWTESTFNIRGKFNSVLFVDKYRAIAVGDKGLLAISDDGGMTWTLQNLDCKENLNKVKSCASDMAVIVGDKGTVFIGSNGGSDWEKVTFSGKDMCNIKGVCSCDGKTLTVVGEGTPEEIQVGVDNKAGVIMESADFGKTWTKVFTDGKCYNHVSFCGKAFGIAIGNGGAVAIYHYEKQLVDLHDLTAYRPQLNNNYPNPFNPSTRISYLIKHADNVRISILNTLGEEVLVLVNEEKTPGTYELEFKADNLTSGVYFYRIQSGRFSETKKMLLMR